MRKKTIAAFESDLKAMNVTDMSEPEQTSLIKKYNSAVLQTTKRQLFYCWDRRLLNSRLTMLLRWSTLIAANLSLFSKPKQQST
jgi:hypothetical protein